MASTAGGVAGRPKPLRVSLRTKCFMLTVSPARSSVRSITVWATWLGWAALLVGTLKRQASMPRVQSLKVKANSSTPLASAARALTK